VRIGVEAPREKQVHRGEVWERIAEEDRPRAA
jgi:sRNA-binding carbon storage regulator CsrA